MAEEGYIKLYRQIRENWIWQNPDYLKAWLDLLLSASHGDHKRTYKGEIQTIERGTVHRSLSSLAKSWGWSRKRVRHFIGLLEGDGMVTTKVSTVDTVITIENWCFFQAEHKKRNSKGYNEGNNEGINEGNNEGTTNNNGKNGNNESYSASGRKKSIGERIAQRRANLEAWEPGEKEDWEKDEEEES